MNQSEYDTLVISDILRSVAPYYLIKAPESEYISVKTGDFNSSEKFQTNLTSYLQRYRMHHDPANYTSQYFYAAYQYVKGVQLLLGINCSRDTMTAIQHLQVASRFGCNEATSALATFHNTGAFGLAKSAVLAFNYYKELFHAWASSTADVDAYQHNYPRRYVELRLGDDGKNMNLPKSERQHMIIEAITGSDRALYGNIVGSGSLTGQFGYKKNDENGARFAFLSAMNETKIKMDPDFNSLEAIIKFQEQEEEDVKTREIERVPERRRSSDDDENDEEQSLKDKIVKIIKRTIFGSEEEEEEVMSEINKYKSFKIPPELRDKLAKY